MTDTFGPISLSNLRVVSIDGDRCQLVGYFTSTKERDELRELCSKWRASRVVELLDGTTYPADLSDTSQNIVYCLWDKGEFIEGFYLIVGYSYDPGIGHRNFYPYVLTLEFVGTRGNYLRGYEINNIVNVSNDWE